MSEGANEKLRIQNKHPERKDTPKDSVRYFKSSEFLGIEILAPGLNDEEIGPVIEEVEPFIPQEILEVSPKHEESVEAKESEESQKLEESKESEEPEIHNFVVSTLPNSLEKAEPSSFKGSDFLGVHLLAPGLNEDVQSVFRSPKPTSVRQMFPPPPPPQPVSQSQQSLSQLLDTIPSFKQKKTKVKRYKQRQRAELLSSSMNRRSEEIRRRKTSLSTSRQGKSSDSRTSKRVLSIEQRILERESQERGGPPVSNGMSSGFGNGGPNGGPGPDGIGTRVVSSAKVQEMARERAKRLELRTQNNSASQQPGNSNRAPGRMNPPVSRPPHGGSFGFSGNSTGSSFGRTSNIGRPPAPGMGQNGFGTTTGGFRTNSPFSNTGGSFNNAGGPFNNTGGFQNTGGFRNTNNSFPTRQANFGSPSGGFSVVPPPGGTGNFGATTGSFGSTTGSFGSNPQNTGNWGSTSSSYPVVPRNMPYRSYNNEGSSSIGDSATANQHLSPSETYARMLQEAEMENKSNNSWSGFKKWMKDGGCYIMISFLLILLAVAALVMFFLWKAGNQNENSHNVETNTQAVYSVKATDNGKVKNSQRGASTSTDGSLRDGLMKPGAKGSKTNRTVANKQDNSSTNEGENFHVDSKDFSNLDD